MSLKDTSSVIGNKISSICKYGLYVSIFENQNLNKFIIMGKNEGEHSWRIILYGI